MSSGICHAGGVHIAAIDNFIDFLNKYLGFNITWDTETLGCWGENLVTLNDTLKEIKAWFNLPQNEQEFAIFMFDDQVPCAPLAVILHNWLIHPPICSKT